MTQFGTSLRFVQLSAVVELLAGVASTGRLRLVFGEWIGEIVVRRGQIVDATLGEQRGLSALEDIVVGFLDADLSFSVGPVSDTLDVLLRADEQLALVKEREAERLRIKALVPSLEMVPRLVDADGNVTIGAAALRILPLLTHGHSLNQIARRRGLARTLRDVVTLMEAGVVELVPSHPKPEPAPEPPTEPTRPIPPRVLAARNASAGRPAPPRARYSRDPKCVLPG